MHLLITAGPTREPIDAVRFLSNRSSGRMGIALARAGIEAGHVVTLLLGPGCCLSHVPDSCRTERFTSSAGLDEQLAAHAKDYDVLIMAAAVSDYRPVGVQEGKVDRRDSDSMTLRLEPTPDLVAKAAARRGPAQVVIAFALEEPRALVARASEKLRTKGVDAIVANPLETMESDTIEPVWITASGEREAPGRMSKDQFAHWLMARVEALVESRRETRRGV